MRSIVILNRLGGWLEGLLVLAVGLYMLSLAGGDLYWTLFNPKFRWVTMLGGLFACIAGLALFFVPAAKPKPTRILCFCFMLTLFATYKPEHTMTGPSQAFDGAESATGDLPVNTGPFAAAPLESETGLETVDGVTYLRANLAEIFFLARQKDPVMLDERYSTFGAVHRSPELDALGQIVLARLTITCCLADAVSVGMRVLVDDPALFREGEWYAVRGKLVTSPLEDPSQARFEAKNAALAVAQEEYALRPDAPEDLRPISPPDMPFIFEVRTLQQ